jgi:hypothetical protein
MHKSTIFSTFKYIPSVKLSDKGLDVTDPNLVQYTYSEHQHSDNLKAYYRRDE